MIYCPLKNPLPEIKFMKKLLFFISFFFVSFILNSSLSIASPINNYLQFFGGYVKAVNNSSVSPSVITFEIWIRPEKITGIQPVISIGNADSSKFHYELGINGGSFYLNYTYGISSARYIAAGQIEDRVWTHLAAVISESTTRLFINGYQVISTSGATDLPAVGNLIVLGKKHQLSSFTPDIYKGDLDELRISAISRDIVNNWNNGIYNSALINDGQTVILWHFDETRGSVQAVDYSGNNINAVLIGGDNKIHFYGILPTPTKFVLPTLRPINWPYTFSRPTQSYSDPVSNPSPAYNFSRSDRPIFPR